MDRCSTKMVSGDTCPNSATRRIQLTARGLVFLVPVCERCVKQMPAAAPSPTDPIQELLRKAGVGR